MMTLSDPHTTPDEALQRWMIRLLVLIAVLALRTMGSAAQPLHWLQADAPQGTGAVDAIHVTRDGRIFASQPSGDVFVSDNNTRSWARIDDGLKGYVTYFIDMPDGTVIAVGSTGIIALSRSERVWHQLRPIAYMPLQENLSSIATDSGGILYVSSFGAGIHRSTDGGATWTTMVNGMDNRVVFDVCALPSNRIFAATERGLYSSDDSGRTWVLRPIGALSTLPLRGLVYDPRIGLLVRSTEKCFFKSTDEGSTWESIFCPYASGPISITKEGVIIAGVASSMAHSYDAGVTWASYPAKTERSEGIGCLGQAPDGTILAGGRSYGLFRSSDMGMSWSPAYTDRMTTRVDGLATDGRGFTVARTSRGMMQTLDSGHHWDWLPHDSAMTNPLALAVGLDRTIYVGTTEGIICSVDSGISWRLTLSDSAIRPITTITVAQSGLVLAAGGRGNIARLDPFSGGWILASTSPGDTITALSVDTKKRIIYCGTTNGTVARSIDAGMTWDRYETGRRIIGLALRKTGEIFVATDPPDIYMTVGWEQPWTTLSNGLDGNPINVLVADTAGVLFIGSRGGGVFRLINHAKNWTSVNDPSLLDLDIKSLATTQGGRLFAGTSSHGVFWSRELTTGVEREMDRTIALSVSPNPCSGTARFNGIVGHAGRLTIHLYDDLGELVATPFDGDVEPGSFQAFWDTGGLATGIYHYTITIGREISSRHMVIYR